MACPVCKSNKDNIVYEKRGIKYYQCNNCQLFYQKGVSVDFLTNFYKTEYCKKNDGARSYEESINRSLRKGLAQIFDLLPENQYILEIGAGAGGASKYCASKGHKIDVIEPYIEYTDKIKEHNINVYSDMFENIDIPEKKYDVVMAFHVIEHFINPMFSINKIYKILKDNGKFIFETPLANIGLVQRATYGFQIPHICIFNSISLKYLLKCFDVPDDIKFEKINIINKQEEKYEE